MSIWNTGFMSLSGGDTGWQRWQTLTDLSLLRVLNHSGQDYDEKDEEEDYYEEANTQSTNSSTEVKQGPKWPKSESKTARKKKFAGGTLGGVSGDLLNDNELSTSVRQSLASKLE
ncbi:hypothetical protein C8J56DRAFT_890728 [Mycena floridula]|nr:hypothetical protein C8J56DRAFT_890728 [Mycena floridula]